MPEQTNNLNVELSLKEVEKPERRLSRRGTVDGVFDDHHNLIAKTGQPYLDGKAYTNCIFADESNRLVVVIVKTVEFPWERYELITGDVKIVLKNEDPPK